MEKGKTVAFGWPLNGSVDGFHFQVSVRVNAEIAGDAEGGVDDLFRVQRRMKDQRSGGGQQNFLHNFTES